MKNYTDRIDTWQPPQNFVTPRAPGEPPAPAPAETSLIRRQDVINYGQALIGTYTEQQRRALAITGEIVTEEPPIDPRAPRLSSPAEIAERRKTAALFVGAQLIAVAIGVAGAVLVAAPKDARLPLWLLATGAGAAAVIAVQYRREQTLSPEGLQAGRDGYAAIVDQMDAESRLVVATAYADAIRMDARAQLTDARSRHQAAENEAARLTAQMDQRHAQRQQTRRAILDEAGAELDAWQPAPTVAETVYQTDPTVGATVETVAPTVETAPPEPADPLLGLLLRTIADLYERTDATPTNALITAPLPWSARSTQIPPAEKERIAATLATIDPPIIVSNGNRYYLNRQHWTGPRRAARAIAAAWRP